MGGSISRRHPGKGSMDSVRDGITGVSPDPHSMKILALELSTTQGSIAWLGDESECMVWPNERKDSGTFFANLESLVQKFGKPGRIVVGLGPGSYAGSRIAISAATGLQAATGSELIGYPSICAIAGSKNDYVVI